MFRILYFLGKQERMNMAAFVEASGQSRQDAAVTRDNMQRLGFISVKKLPGHGNAGELDIRLTKLGREVWDHLHGIDKTLKD